MPYPRPENLQVFGFFVGRRAGWLCLNAYAPENSSGFLVALYKDHGDF